MQTQQTTLRTQRLRATTGVPALFLFLAILGGGLFPWQGATPNALIADDAVSEDEGPAVPRSSRVTLTLAGATASIDVMTDGSLRNADGIDVGEWTEGSNGTDAELDLLGLPLTLVSFMTAAEGESGALLGGGGDDSDAEASWTVEEIDLIAQGTTIFNLELMIDYALIGNFEEQIIDGEPRDVAIGEGNLVEVYGEYEDTVLEVEDGCTVFIGGDVSGFSGLVIQDPQGPIQRRPQGPGRRIVPSPPALYPKGVWQAVSEDALGCFDGNPADPVAGRNCGKPKTNCAAAVQQLVGGKARESMHIGTCGNAGQFYKEFPNGTLYVNF